MKRKTIFLTIALVTVVLALVGCTGKKETSGGNSGGTVTESNASGNTGAVFTIPKEKINPLGFGTDSEKQAVIAEIPEELFKAIGKLSYCNIQRSGTLPGYKYTLVIRTSNEDGKADLKKLVEYYRSIGGTVVEKVSGHYDVTFDYAESVTVEGLSSYIQLQFSVVKE
jgi:uncharacterized lipoprotein NlpE involved in copper resistance